MGLAEAITAVGVDPDALPAAYWRQRYEEVEPTLDAERQSWTVIAGQLVHAERLLRAARPHVPSGPLAQGIDRHLRQCDSAARAASAR